MRSLLSIPLVRSQLCPQGQVGRQGKGSGEPAPGRRSWFSRSGRSSVRTGARGASASFLRANDENGAGRLSDRFLRDAPKEKARQPRPRVGPDHDQVGIELLGLSKDLLNRVAGRGHGLRGDVLPLLPEDVPEAGQGFLPDLLEVLHEAAFHVRRVAIKASAVLGNKIDRKSVV